MQEDEAIQVRVAGPEDEDDLLVLCRLWHGEEGMRDGAGLPLTFCAEKARDHIRSWLAPVTEDGDIAMCGVIGDPGMIEASICVVLTTPWCSQRHILRQVWYYVRPAYRRGPHSRALITFGQSVADFLRSTLELRPSRSDAKERFIARLGGVERSGGVFLYQPGGAAL